MSKDPCRGKYRRMIVALASAAKQEPDIYFRKTFGPQIVEAYRQIPGKKRARRARNKSVASLNNLLHVEQIAEDPHGPHYKAVHYKHAAKLASTAAKKSV